MNYLLALTSSAQLQNENGSLSLKSCWLIIEVAAVVIVVGSICNRSRFGGKCEFGFGGVSSIPNRRGQGLSSLKYR